MEINFGHHDIHNSSLKSSYKLTWKRFFMVIFIKINKTSIVKINMKIKMKFVHTNYCDNNHRKMYKRKKKTIVKINNKINIEMIMKIMKTIMKIVAKVSRKSPGISSWKWPWKSSWISSWKSPYTSTLKDYWKSPWNSTLNS